MKKVFTIAALALAITVQANAQSLWDTLFGSNADATATASTIADILASFGGQTVYSAPVSLNGTYTYAGSAVTVGKTDGNAVSTLAGSAVSTALEGKVDQTLAKIGIEPGTMTVTFNSEDNSFVWIIAGIPLPGTYKVGDLEKTVTMTFGKNMQFLSLTGNLECTATGAKLLFPAPRTVAFLKKVAAKLGEKSSTVAGLAKLADGYDNFKIGFKLTK